MAFACCFLPDELLLSYLTATAEEFTSKGNLEGLIVSELGEGRREGERERKEGRRKREWEVGLGNLSEIDKCRK